MNCVYVIVRCAEIFHCPTLATSKSFCCRIRGMHIFLSVHTVWCTVGSESIITVLKLSIQIQLGSVLQVGSSLRAIPRRPIPCEPYQGVLFQSLPDPRFDSVQQRDQAGRLVVIAAIGGTAITHHMLDLSFHKMISPRHA